MLAATSLTEPMTSSVVARRCYAEKVERTESLRVPRDLTDDEFVSDLMGEIKEAGFSRAAWRRFWRRALTRALTNVRARPRRRAATLSWMGAGAVLAAVVLGVGGASVTTLCIAGLWFVLASTWTYLHQGLIRREDGTPYDGFLLANGLSFLRFALAPLVAAPVLQPGHEGGAAIFMAGFLAFLVMTDQLDGLLARGLDQTSRLGRLIDPLADLAVMSWLAVALTDLGMLSTAALVLVLLRYPGSLVGAMILSFAVGPRYVTATLVGKATTWLVFVSFIGAGGLFLLAPERQGDDWLRWAMDGITVLLAINLAYLAWRALAWRQQPEHAAPATTD